MLNTHKASISDRTNACLELLRALCRILYKSPEKETELGVTHATAWNELIRLNIWAENIGAAQAADSSLSLTARLKNAPRTTGQVVELLKDMEDTLVEARSILLGDSHNGSYEFYELEDVDSSEHPSNDAKINEPSYGTINTQHMSQIQELFKLITEINTNLFRASSNIRKTTPRDRYIRASIKYPDLEAQYGVYERQHVENKFPKLRSLMENQGQDWLVDRLGRAITWRRQYLRYCQEHAGVLSGVEKPKSDFSQRNLQFPETGPLQEVAEVNPMVEAYPPSTINFTTATTFFEGTLANNLTSNETEEADEEDALSLLATSVGSNEGGRVAIVGLDQVRTGNIEFVCPYCHQAQKYRNDRVWRKHVFEDLRPYVCTFEKCEIKLFPRCRDWFSHEREFHRLEWLCNFCSKASYSSGPKLEAHLQAEHIDKFVQSQLPILVDDAKRPIDEISAGDCPFCDDFEKKLRQLNPQIPRDKILTVHWHVFRDHVGRHMKDLATFAIPRSLGSDDCEKGVISGDSANPVFDIDDRNLDGDETNEERSFDFVETIPSIRNELFNSKQLVYSCGLDEHRVPFISKNVLDDVITIDRVTHIILGLGGAHTEEIYTEEEAFVHATKICSFAKQLFSILVCIEKSGAIISLLDNGYSDDDLPLTQSQASALPGKDVDVASTFGDWDKAEQESFYANQWLIAVPVFENMKHYVFPPETALPFIFFDGAKDLAIRVSEHSEAFAVRLHPAHHNFWTTGPEGREHLIAIKTRLHQEKEDSERLAATLRFICSKRHPHILQMLATYHRHGKCHVMYRYADCNLREYWGRRTRTSSEVRKEIFLWSLRQLAGLTSALHLIHDSLSQRSIDKNHLTSGLSGNLNPESILWFQSLPHISNKNGTLQLGVNFEKASHRNTYDPPFQFNQRSRDIWSLGCLYLDFMTWLLTEDEGYEFAKFRTEISSIDDSLNDDCFFTVNSISPGGGWEDSIVRPSVIQWVERLHLNERCSQMIHDVLDLTMSDLLVIDPNHRIHPSLLTSRMNDFVDRAARDEDYLVSPRPYGEKSTSAPKTFDTRVRPLETAQKINSAVKAHLENQFHDISVQIHEAIADGSQAEKTKLIGEKTRLKEMRLDFEKKASVILNNTAAGPIKQKEDMKELMESIKYQQNDPPSYIEKPIDNSAKYGPHTSGSESKSSKPSSANQGVKRNLESGSNPPK